MSTSFALPKDEVRIAVDVNEIEFGQADFG